MRNSVAVLLVIYFVACILSTCHANFSDENPIQLLRDDPTDCLSWRLAVETNNLRNWSVVPQSCAKYVGIYMLGQQYVDDCNAMADAAIQYAKSIKPNSDGKDVWVFDIDETTLSNIEYYTRDEVLFGSKPYNRDNFRKWLEEGKSTAAPAVLRLYNTVLALKFKTVILTGVSDELTKVRSNNLEKEGYHGWTEIIFKKKSEKGPGVVFKSKKRTELVKKGYRIVGNVGDQWSDILGDNAGNRTFKVPNPMYYLN